ncbi:hypothetical protein ACIBI3_12405 [Actinomadura luteofluorescens]|uniref:hypothetical protein n=1 Tax=Actinomadura luteofluorescens TaxID=46163 RepID=UPI00348B5833
MSSSAGLVLNVSENAVSKGANSEQADVVSNSVSCFSTSGVEVRAPLFYRILVHIDGLLFLVAYPHTVVGQELEREVQFLFAVCKADLARDRIIGDEQTVLVSTEEQVFHAAFPC